MKQDWAFAAIAMLSFGGAAWTLFWRRVQIKWFNPSGRKLGAFKAAVRTTESIGDWITIVILIALGVAFSLLFLGLINAQN